MAGRDRSTISLIESNHNFPQPATIQRIAGALDVPPEALTDPFWDTTVPKAPPPRSMDELLERAGVADRTFTMSLTEIGEAFEGLSYQEAYTLAREIADVRAAVKPVLALYAGSPEEVSLTVKTMECNMVANLSFQAIAERERSRAVEQGDAERAEQIEKEEQEVKLLEKRVA
jgi:transcriptional regulator with XRE-family HTH domain